MTARVRQGAACRGNFRIRRDHAHLKGSIAMADVVYVLVTIGFFALAVAYVRGLERV